LPFLSPYPAFDTRPRWLTVLFNGLSLMQVSHANANPNGS
jgi:hypothetical protein